MNDLDRELQGLVQRCRAGFRPAFAEVLERCRRPLFAYLFRMARNHELAEDMLQETFIAMHAGLPTYDASRRFMPWAFAIARNKYLEWRRREEKVVRLVPRAAAKGSAERPGESPDPLDTVPSPVDHAAATIVRLDVARVLSELSEPIREAFVLKHFNGLRFAEVAEIQEIPESTAKSRVAFAIRKLEEALSR